MWPNKHWKHTKFIFVKQNFYARKFNINQRREYNLKDKNSKNTIVDRMTVKKKKIL